MQLRKFAPLMLLLAVAPAAPAQDGGMLAQAAELTPKDMVQGARTALEEMHESAAETARLLETAERKGEPEEVDCVRTRNSAVVALEGVSETANRDMNAALAVDQVPRASHEYRKIEVALGKVRQFTGEAQACVGGGAVADDTTEVSGGEALSDGTDETEGSGIDDGVVGVDPPGTTPFE